MTRATLLWLLILFAAACGADGPPEPVGESTPEERSIGVTSTINVEGVL